LSGPSIYDDRRRAVGKVAWQLAVVNLAVVTLPPVPDILVIFLGHESRDRRKKAKRENHVKKTDENDAGLIAKATSMAKSKK